MPLYDFKCQAGHGFERFLPLARYDEAQNCDCGQPAVRQISAPMVLGDLPGYTSPIDGRWIEGKSQRREDLRRNGCVEWDPGMRDDHDRRRQREEQQLDTSLESSIESEIQAMPVRKRELLEQEVRAGASADVVRLTPTT